MTLPPLYLLHPMVVHFPIALLAVGWLFGLVGQVSRRWPWLPVAATWLLWLGTLAAWIALGLGLLAAHTAPHRPMAWQELNEHRIAGYWTVGWFTSLSVLKWWWQDRHGGWFLILWLIAYVVLAVTADHGAQLVFTFGMGVGIE